jgi:hypothetical protein
MVKITPAEFFAKQRQEQEPEATGDNAWLLGGNAGKHIVLALPRDEAAMQGIGALLQQLGAEFVDLSNRHALPYRTKILEWRELIDETNRRVRSMAGAPPRR